MSRRANLPVCLVAALLSSCGGRAAGGTARADEYRGEVLAPPLAESDFTLTATNGRPYHFERQTDGVVALLFFGYTHCPEVCPVHLANLAATLRRLPPEVSRSVRVVFVTVDPERDTPRALRAWLDHFDSAFVGLRGPLDAVNRIQERFRMEATVIERLPNGEVAVGHGAYVIALVGDSARVLYPFGTRQEDWLHDLPQLVRAIPAARGAN